MKNVIITEADMLAEHIGVLIEDELDFLAVICRFGRDDEAGGHFNYGLVCPNVFKSEHTGVLGVAFAKHDRVLYFWMPDSFFFRPVKESFEADLSILGCSFP